MNARKILNELTWAEVDGSLAPDCRRVLSDERVALAGALKRGDRQEIAAACVEAQRVADMWGVRLPRAVGSGREDLG